METEFENATITRVGGKFNIRYIKQGKIERLNMVDRVEVLGQGLMDSKKIEDINLGCKGMLNFNEQENTATLSCKVDNND